MIFLVFVMYVFAFLGAVSVEEILLLIYLGNWKERLAPLVLTPPLCQKTVITMAVP